MNPLKSGTLDLALLSALQDQPRYGLEILKYVNERSQGLFDLREGSLYPALQRLQKTGWIDSEYQQSNLGGAPRKVYRLTDQGNAVLTEKKREWQQLRGAVDALLIRNLA